MAYTYATEKMDSQDIENGKLSGMLNNGRELVFMVPRIMEPADGKTQVAQYWVVLREPK
jgi:hypothetical protein